MSADAMRETVTIEEVAAAAGVSRSTVSRVVNGSTAVSPEALEAVRKAIADLNYVPNRAARSLASKQTHAIALENHGLDTHSLSPCRRCRSRWRRGSGWNRGMSEMKSRRLLIGIRHREQLCFLEQATEESERYCRAVFPESVWKNHRRMSSKIGGDEL